MAYANFTKPIQMPGKYFHILQLLFAFVAFASLVPAKAQAGETDAFHIAVFGDSLGAGYQLPTEEGFPAVLERALRKAGHKVSVSNASVSGDTSSSGLARIDWALGGKVDVVILELGANDMLRGIDPKKTREALDAIIKRIKAKGVQVLLAGMVAAPGMGKFYEDSFNAIYPSLAKVHNLELMPFFLEGVAGRREFQLADGMHPNAAGVAVMVRNILPHVEKLIAGKNANR